MKDSELEELHQQHELSLKKKSDDRYAKREKLDKLTKVCAGNMIDRPTVIKKRNFIFTEKHYYCPKCNTELFFRHEKISAGFLGWEFAHYYNCACGYEYAIPEDGWWDHRRVHNI